MRSLVSTGVLLPYVVVSPYSTLLSDGDPVTQVIVAPTWVIDETATELISLSGVGVGPGVWTGFVVMFMVLVCIERFPAASEARMK